MTAATLVPGMPIVEANFRSRPGEALQTPSHLPRNHPRPGSTRPAIRQRPQTRRCASGSPAVRRPRAGVMSGSRTIPRMISPSSRRAEKEGWLPRRVYQAAVDLLNRLGHSDGVPAHVQHLGGIGFGVSSPKDSWIAEGRCSRWDSQPGRASRSAWDLPRGGGVRSRPPCRFPRRGCGSRI